VNHFTPRTIIILMKTIKDLYQSLNVRTLRAFIAFDGPISSSDAIDWAFPKADRRPNTLNRSVRRALESIGAVRVGRSKTGRGTPIMWRLADDQSSDLHAAANTGPAS